MELKQHAIEYARFRDTFKRYESQEMHIYHQKLGGLTSWIPVSDDRIYEAFLKGEQRENPLVKVMEEQRKNNEENKTNK